MFVLSSSGCVSRITNDAHFVGCGAGGRFGIQLGGKLACHMDGGFLGLNLPFLDTVGYEDGQCCSHNTASL